MDDILKVLAGALIGFVFAVFLDRAKHWLNGPRVELTFETNADYIAETTEGQIDQVQDDISAFYIRIKAKNKGHSIAKQCRAYLIGVDIWDDIGNKYIATKYSDSLQLSWSCRNKNSYDGLDLPAGINQYIDVVSTRSISSKFRPEIQFFPKNYVTLFNERSRFKFKVLVSGENVTPVCIDIMFDWNGVWNKFKADRV